jgi:head-tail adaptor
MSNYLTDAELASMRASLEDVALPDVCNILSVTRTPDGQGGFTDSWGTASTSVPCRLHYSQGVETVAGGGLKAFSGWVLTLPYATTISAANRVEVGSDTYSVTSVDSGKSWSTCIRVKLAKL